MAMHTLPKNLPGDWIASFKMPSRDGCYESFIVIRPITEKGAYDKFMVHNAFFMDEGENKGKWSYSTGDYVKTLESATARFTKRAGLLSQESDE